MHATKADLLYHICDELHISAQEPGAVRASFIISVPVPPLDKSFNFSVDYRLTATKAGGKSKFPGSSADG